jgi:hypothetical protein
MPPKKEKAEKASASAQEDMVFEYLRKQKYEAPSLTRPERQLTPFLSQSPIFSELKTPR